MKIDRARRLAKATRFGLTVLALSMASFTMAAGSGWVPTLEQALQIAKQQQKPIFVDFTTSWCGVCKIMDRTVMADPSIIGRLDNFVKVKVDGDVRADLCSMYGVMAYPTFVHLDPQGRVVAKREGQMRTQEMASALDSTWGQVAASRSAVVQASANRRTENIKTVADEPRAEKNQVASADLKLLPGREDGEQSREESSRSASRSAKGGDGVNYDPRDPALANSVYAMNASPTAQRSRFGDDRSNSLRALANATAQPGSIEDSEKTDSDKEKASKEAEEKSVALKAKEQEKAEAQLAAAKAEEAMKIADEKKLAEAEKMALDKKNEVANAVPPVTNLTLKAPAPTVVSDTSPVVQSRLNGISGDELPRPLLTRTVGATQAMTPAPTISTVANSNEVLSTIRKMQGSDAAPAAQPAAAPPAVPGASVKVASTPVAAAATTKAAPAPATVLKPESTSTAADEPKKEVASATKTKTIEPAAKTTADEKSEKSDKPSASEKETADAGEKTSTGATRGDLDRWLKDADAKLLDGRKREARAMYTKVVENDPKNVSGKTDMAYVKMVSLIVDKDSDLQRREAYNKIKEFEARYPNSNHKDYYTLIRAILAIDLDEINEAHRLLGTFAERFPESKYLPAAHKNWKELPSIKKESPSSKSKSNGSSTKSSTGSSKSSGSSTKSSSGSSKSSSGSSKSTKKSDD